MMSNLEGTLKKARWCCHINYTEKTVQLRELYFGPQNQKILLSEQYYGMVLRTIRVQVRQLYKFVDMTIPCIAIVNKILCHRIALVNFCVHAKQCIGRAANQYSCLTYTAWVETLYSIPVYVEQLYCFFRVPRESTARNVLF